MASLSLLAFLLLQSSSLFSLSLAQVLDRDPVTWRITFHDIADPTNFGIRLTRDMVSEAHHTRDRSCSGCSVVF